MLSAMTTADNFPLRKQSPCSGSSYKSEIGSTYDHLRKTTQIWIGGDRIPCRRLRRVPALSCHRIPAFCCLSSNPAEEEIDLSDVPDVVIGENEFQPKEIVGSKLEYEQLKANDSSSDKLKPLKIHSTVLKLYFSKLPHQFQANCGLHTFYLTELLEMKRTSRYLCGGGLPQNAVENFRNPSHGCLNYRFSNLSEVELNVFCFKHLIDLGLRFGSVTRFLNQITPSSPPSLDLPVQKRQSNKISNAVSSEEGGSKNPFKNFTSGIGQDRNAFPPTNPFKNVRVSSGLHENVEFVSHAYENIELPQKSFPRCYNRSASLVMRAPEEYAVSNPFLKNDASLEFCSSATIFTDESKSPTSADPCCSSNTFILAVPVFPIFQQNTTSSSTQKVDSSKATAFEDPAYQNITNQLRKFLRSKDHSLYDLLCLKATVKDLRNSGWYHENVSWRESVTLLADTEPGTFLIRDSSDPNFLFTLSVQTSRGPTSVRIHYVNGQFRLDAEEELIPQMPSFNSVTELIDYYVESTAKNKSNIEAKSEKKTSKPICQKSTDQVWIDSVGNVYSTILLVKPLYKSDHFSPLQHLARLTINRILRKRLNDKAKFNFRVTPIYESHPFQNSSFQNNFDNFFPILNIDFLPLPSRLLDYLKEYPFCH